MHLALVSSISFGGFPTVLPDVRNFAVGTHGWMTDQDFANLFAMAQSIPGPNMRAVESDPDALETALKHTTVTLQDELKANEQEGKSISGKSEIEHDALQLSVYTLDGDDFLEVIAGPKTGAIAKTEKIADADDLGDATAQKAAMEEATVSLLAVANAAASANPGLRVVSIYRQLRNGHPVAEVTLLAMERGAYFKMVTERLD